MDEVAGKRFEDSTLAKTAKFFIYAPPLITQRKSKRPLTKCTLCKCRAMANEHLLFVVAVFAQK